MRVVLLQRRQRRAGNFSVELIVEGLLQNLSPEFEARVAVSRFVSNGIFRRIYNIVEAAFRQADLNHVTGDVHFLTYLLRKRKTVLTVLDCGPLDGPIDLRRRLLKLLWYTIPTRRCAAITVISSAVKRDLLRHVRLDPAKVHVVPVAVPSLYRHIPRPFDRDRPVILQIGTSPNKNLPRLFEALAGIPCRLDIVGRLGDEHRALLARHAIDHREYSGLSNEAMLERYAECDLVSFASTFEGFGMPIIEANLVGRPVVTGNVTSMPEVAGNAACLVDPFDAAAIRAGILRVIADDAYRAELVRNGFENAKRYDVRMITRMYESVYRQVAAADGRA